MGGAVVRSGSRGPTGWDRLQRGGSVWAVCLRPVLTASGKRENLVDSAV